MEEHKHPAPTSGRAPVIVTEVVLLALTLWILIWRPLGENLSPVVAIIMALLFIGLFPAMLKGNKVAAAEREHIARRYSRSDDNRER